MANCLRVLDAFYKQPWLFAADLMAGILFFGRMEDPDHVGLVDY
jgi:hypothetical protein